MEPEETRRLLKIIYDKIATGKVKAARTREQIADIEKRGVSSMWSIIAPTLPEIIEFGDSADDHVVGCMPYKPPNDPLIEPDNKVGLCAWGCMRVVQWRPYVPDTVPKICLYCMAERPLDDQ